MTDTAPAKRTREPAVVRLILVLLRNTAWRVPPRWRRGLWRSKTFRKVDRAVFRHLGERVVWDRTHDFALLVDLRDFDQRAHFRRPHVEEHVVQYLSARARHGSIAVDAGAFCGYYAVLMAKRVGPSGHVFAIEPTPKYAARIRRQVTLNGLHNLTVLEAAAAASAGKRRLVPKGPSSHLISRGEELADALDVEVIALDDLQDRVPERRDWVIKLDVEGAELEALQGARRLFATGRACAVVEVNSAEIEEQVRAFASDEKMVVRQLGDSFHGRHLALEPSSTEGVIN